MIAIKIHKRCDLIFSKYIWGLLLVLFSTSNEVIGQHEVKLYSGVLTDFPGISYAYRFDNALKLELGTSFFQRYDFTNNWNGSDVKNRYNSNYINLRLMKIEERKNGLSFNFGGYFRYLLNRWERLGVSASTLQYLNQNKIEAAKKTYTHKISLGVLWEIEKQLSKKADTFWNHTYFSFTNGWGVSFPSMYWEKEIRYLGSPVISNVGPDSWFGYVNHLSLIIEMGVSHRF